MLNKKPGLKEKLAKKTEESKPKVEKKKKKITW